MADYRIVCTQQVPIDPPTSHAHIVRVGHVAWRTGAISHYERLESTEVIIARMANGDRFFTWSPSTGAVAQVHPIKCLSCNLYTSLRSAPDAILDNNLDNLAKCS